MDSKLMHSNDEESCTDIEALKLKIRQYQRFFMIITVSTCVIMVSALPNLSYVKDVLKTSPAQLAIFSTLTRVETVIKPFIGYIEDKYSPFGGFKIKFFITISSVCLISIYLFISLFKPNIGLFSVLMVAKGISVSISDSMAQGMTAMTLKFQKKLEKIDPSSSKANDSMNFGYQQIVGNIFRLICIYIGGDLAGKVDIGTIYMWMTVVPIFTLLYTFIIFREDTQFNLSAGDPEIAETSEEISMNGIKNEILQVTGNIESMNFKEKSSLIWKILSKEEIKYPLILMVFSSILPIYGETQLFIMTDPIKGGWTYNSLALCTLLSGLFYLPIIFILLPKLLKKGTGIQFFIATTSFAIFSLSQFSILYSEEINFNIMFLILMLLGILTTCGIDFLIIPIVGKYSKYCPKGMENFGLTLLTTVLSFFSLIGGFISSPLLIWFQVDERNYDNLAYLLMISLIFRIVIVILVPILIRR